MIKITLSIKKDGCYQTIKRTFKNQKELDKFYDHFINDNSNGKIIGTWKEEIKTL